MFRILTCCGARHLPSATKRLGICRPLPLAPFASSAAGSAQVAPARRYHVAISPWFRRIRTLYRAGGGSPPLQGLSDTVLQIPIVVIGLIKQSSQKKNVGTGLLDGPAAGRYGLYRLQANSQSGILRGMALSCRRTRKCPKKSA